MNDLVKGRVRPGQVLVLRQRKETEEPRVKIARPVLRNSELFNEKDYEQSLADLIESDPNQHIDLSKNVELKADSVRQLNTAYGFLGTRYRFGGSGRSGIDCSSFVQKVFQEMDVSLPRTAREQYEVGIGCLPGT